MGQCPSVHSTDADEVKILTMEELFHRQRHNEHSQPNGSDEIAALCKAFLKLHRHDRIQKCLLDPSEVHSALHQQADFILDKQGVVKDEAAIFAMIDSASRQHDIQESSFRVASPETLSVVTGFTSDVAPSEFTTETDATRLITNSGRTSRKNNFSEYLGRGKASSIVSNNSYEGRPEELGLIRTPGGTVPNVNCRDSEQEYSDVDSLLERRRQEVLRKYANIFSACIQPKSDSQMMREGYMSVLHLRMKAQLGHYFTQRYSPMFSRSLGVHVAISSNSTPGLVRNDSDSSFSDSGEGRVGFGALPPSNSVYARTTGAVFMDLATTGSLGLVPRCGFRGKRPFGIDQKSPDHYIVLMNRRSGVPLAVCALKATDGLPVVRIYATKQRVFKQRSAATTEQVGLGWCGKLPLYPWAEVVTERMYPDPAEFSMYMASGSEGRFAAQPSYMAAYKADKGTPLIKVIGRTDQETCYSGCAVVSLEASLPGDGDISFHVDVSSGIDPALMICFTAIMDEVIEKSMRMQCKQYRQKTFSY